jgi:ATP-dependent DNA ligase
MKYDSYRYIYPPRPKNPIPPTDLNFWDNGGLICQPKLNGSNSVIFKSPSGVKAMNRHNQSLTGFRISDELKSILPQDGHFVINGEYMNKGKLDQFGNNFNHKLVIFDILVQNSEYLVGKSVSNRLEILNSIFNPKESKWGYLHQISENIFMVKSFENNFKSTFDYLTKIDMVEGVVLKRKSAKLEIGIREENNSNWMLKSRKPHKNYKF